MSFFALLRKQLTPTKLFFHFLFWTFHWGIFAYGWYALPGIAGCGVVQGDVVANTICVGGSKRPTRVWRA